MRNLTIAVLAAAFVTLTVLQCAMAGGSVAEDPMDRHELVLARSDATVTSATMTSSLPFDLSMTATALAVQLKPTSLPQPPRTGGGGSAVATAMPAALPRTGHADPARPPAIAIAPRRPALIDLGPEFTVEAKWPKRMLLSKSHIVSLILQREGAQANAYVFGTDDRLGLVSDRVALPVGTPDADIDIAFGAGRRLFVEADLVATDFEVVPPVVEARRVLSGQDRQEWSWVITPRTAGPRQPVARLHMGWEEAAPAARAVAAAPTTDITIPMAMVVAAGTSPWSRWWPTLLGLALAVGGAGYGVTRRRREAQAVQRFSSAHGQDLERVRDTLAGAVGDGKTTDRLVASLAALAYRHRDALAQGRLSSEELGALLARDLGADAAATGSLLTLRGANVGGNVSVGDVAGGDVVHIDSLQVILPPHQAPPADG